MPPVSRHIHVASPVVIFDQLYDSTTTPARDTRPRLSDQPQGDKVRHRRNLIRGIVIKERAGRPGGFLTNLGCS